MHYAFNHETLTTCAPTNQVPVTVKLLLLMLHCTNIAVASLNDKSIIVILIAIYMKYVPALDSVKVPPPIKPIRLSEFYGVFAHIKMQLQTTESHT